MNVDQVEAWVAKYERAWRSPGTDALHELFTEDATYSQSPYTEPVVGIEAISEMWEAEREGPDEPFAMTSERVAVDGEVAVVRVEVHYDGPPAREYRDLWIFRLDREGRCTAFEEWPFWPGRPYAADG